MQAEGIQQLLQILTENGMLCCVVGEFALNYYNVPVVIHELELCIPAAELAKANDIFMSKPHMLAPESQETYNLYTIHKQGLPGFRYLPESSSYVVLFPDDRLGLAPLRKNILHQKRHEDGAEYSREILDVIPASKIAGIPIPLLGPFFSGQCAGYLGTNHPMFAMAAERLVDGMDLDEEWCRQHISASASETLSFALTLVARKASRIDYFSSNTVTCFIPDEQERQRLLRVPGRNDGTHEVS